MFLEAPQLPPLLPRHTQKNTITCIQFLHIPFFIKEDIVLGYLAVYKYGNVKQFSELRHSLCCISPPPPLQESQMPKDLEETCQVTYAALSNPNTRPVIIIIDALNQVMCFIIHRGPF